MVPGVGRKTRGKWCGPQSFVGRETPLRRPYVSLASTTSVPQSSPCSVASRSPTKGEGTRQRGLPRRRTTVLGKEGVGIFTKGYYTVDGCPSLGFHLESGKRSRTGPGREGSPGLSGSPGSRGSRVTRGLCFVLSVPLVEVLVPRSGSMRPRPTSSSSSDTTSVLRALGQDQPDRLTYVGGESRAKRTQVILTVERQVDQYLRGSRPYRTGRGSRRVPPSLRLSGVTRVTGYTGPSLFYGSKLIS